MRAVRDALGTIRLALAAKTAPGPATLDDVETLKQMAPGSPDTWVAAAMVRNRLGDQAGAVEALNTALELNPAHTTALLLKGDLAQARGDLTEADDLYLRAFKVRPDDRAANRLALLRIAGGYLESARDILTTALELDPGSSATRNNLAVVLDRMGETSSAIRLLEETPTEDARLLHTRALLKLKEGFTERASRDLENAHESGEELNLLLIAGILDLQRGRFAAAEDRFRKAVAAYPEVPESYLYLGQTLRRQGRFQDAEKVFLEGLSATDDVDLHLNLGILYELYRSDPDGAMTHYRHYVEMGGAGAARVQGWIDYLTAIVPEAGTSGGTAP